MDKSLQELSEMTFKQSENVDISNLSLDIKMLNIFWAMDGSRDLKTVAREEAYDLEELAASVQNLMKIGALEAKVMEGFVDKETLDILTQNLSQTIGPVADILVEDTISDMGHSLSSLPNHKLEQLVNQLALEIRDKERSESFKSSMAQFIE
ncbi:MAG: hypothetical protein PVH87_25715 [Desulfobacteraceae bacterium]|jgi:hypothetical protein